MSGTPRPSSPPPKADVRCLLDTNAFLWLASEPRRLSPLVRQLVALGDTELVLSAVVPWELAIKEQLGKLTVDEPLAALIAREVESLRLEELPVTRVHALASGKLPNHHRDPFDRLLLAQAIVEDMSIISADRALLAYPATVVW